MDYSNKLSFLEGFLGKFKFHNSAKEAIFFCPQCHHYKQKLSINVETDMFHCWVCQFRGVNLVYLIKKFGNSDDLRRYKEKYKSSKVEIVDEIPVDFQLRLPKEFLPLIHYKDSPVGKSMWKYLTKKRGIEEKDILFYKIGFSTGEHKGIVFLSFDVKGALNFYTIRQIESYWKPSTPRNYTNCIIPNELNINWKEPVIITEGFIDILKTPGNAIPLFGSVLPESSKLFEEIVKNNTIVFLALDSDAQDKASKIASSFMRYGVTCYNIDVHPYEDVGAMTKKEFVIAYRNATLLTEQENFRNKLRVLCA